MFALNEIHLFDGIDDALLILSSLKCIAFSSLRLPKQQNSFPKH